MSNLSAIPVDLTAAVPAGGETDQYLTVDGTTGGVQFAAWGGRVSHIFWTAETAQMRFTLDSSAPTSTNGHCIEDGDSGVWPRAWFQAAKFIRTTGTSGFIHASPLTLVGA